MKVTLLILVSTCAVLACRHAPASSNSNEIQKSTATDTAFKVETVVGNLEVPWAIAWTPDGRMLFTERPGRVRVFERGSLQPEPLFTVPDVEPSGESGLMDLTLHPQFKANHFVYLSYAYKGDGQRVR